jgi:hypothetical protein
MKLDFSDEQIQSLFGDEAADYENIDRLRTYYLKTPIYEQFRAKLPLRILVGHKGIGKSALFRFSMSEDSDANVLSILIRPDDIAEIGGDTSDFLKLIRAWRIGLSEIITRKVLTSVGAKSDGIGGAVARISGNIIEFLRSSLNGSGNISFDAAKSLLVEQFVKNRSINIYIDDLDRGWQGRREDILRISALLNAVRDITVENPGIHFRISLRSDVYFLVRTSDESTDKIEGSVLWQSWTNHDIFVLLVKRIETFFGRNPDDSSLLNRDQSDLATYLPSVMEERFRGKGKWQIAPIHRILMSLIRARPRDLVKLCTLSAREARRHNSNRILTEHFTSVFPDYSQGRVQDTINEFRSELPDVERLLLNMKPAKRTSTTEESYIFTTDALLKKIQRILERGQLKFAVGAVATPKQLAGFMYKINFLTARKETPAGVQRFYFEQNRYLSNELADFGYHWEIHPAYRWALQPDDPNEIYSRFELSID